MKRKWKLPFPVLADVDNAYAKQLGIAFELPTDLQEVYAAFGIDLPGLSGTSAWELPLATRLVIAADGTVASIDTDPDYTIRPEVSATLDAVRALS